jgi:Spy/CpxP family protein refolding chaperone
LVEKELVMSRWSVVLALALIVAMSAAVSAQTQPKKGGGRGMGGSGLGVSLLLMDKVQKELQLSDEQKGKLLMLGMQMQQGGNRGNVEKQLMSILRPEQLQRLKEIRLQIDGPAALTTSPELAKELELTAEQLAKLKTLQGPNRDKMRESLQGTPEQRHAKMLELRKEAMDKALEVLTSEQQEKFEKMQGKKVDLELPKPGPQGGWPRQPGPR